VRRHHLLDLPLQLRRRVRHARPNRTLTTSASTPPLNGYVRSRRVSARPWIFERAKAHGGFDVELVDLRDAGLPLFDEPNHPRLRQYEHEHTKRWSAKIDAADAFVFVTPEYNHASPPSLINALDYLVHEWAHKPASFVSYGGAAGGTRAVQMVKPMLVALKMVALQESVMVPFFANSIDAQQVFNPTELQESHAKTMLDALAKWVRVLAPLRA
jgi:NAD(P)H-dependent FMN reductase